MGNPCPIFVFFIGLTLNLMISFFIKYEEIIYCNRERERERERERGIEKSENKRKREK